MEYDVFISSKSEDYHLAEGVYDFLRSQGLSVFIASEELKRIGEAQYADAIDEVLDNSIHMIVVASSVDHIKSKWVKHEWSTFSNDLKSGYRSGNLVTILSGAIALKSLPASLRHQQSFPLENYKDEILDFLPVSRKESASATQESSKDTSGTSTSVFKFYSNENCQVFLEGKFVAELTGMSDEPYCFYVPKKGDYRFKCVNLTTGEFVIRKKQIGSDESKEVEVLWEDRKPLVPEYEWPNGRVITGDKFTVDLGSVQFDLLRVDGGKMTVGATEEQKAFADINEYPAHEITVPTYYIGKFPVTQNVWEIVMGYNKSYFKDKEERAVKVNHVLKTAIKGGIAGTLGMLVGGLGAATNIFPDKDHMKSTDKWHYPAENMTLDDALEFVRRLSLLTNIKFDLPTEQEWEYAARGGVASKGYRFSGSDSIDEVAWYCDNAERSTHPVGEKLPNELGIYDMCGNVWEWTKTPAHTYCTGLEPQGDVFIRRGGSWWHQDKNCRVSFRYASHRLKKTSGLGLRVVVRENIK